MISVMESLVDRIVLLDASMFAIWLISWVLLALAGGGVAQGKGHQGGGYFLLGLLLSPVIGMIVAFCLKDERAARISALAERLRALERASGGAQVDSGASPAATAVSSPNAWRFDLGSAAGFVMVTIVILGGVWFYMNRPL